MSVCLCARVRERERERVSERERERKSASDDVIIVDIKNSRFYHKKCYIQFY